MLRIRIRIVLKGRIRIRIKVISWIRIRINLQMTSKNVWKMSLFVHFLKVLSLYLEARLRIRIRIKVKGIVGSGSASKDKQDPDPHQSERFDSEPDPHQSDKQEPQRWCMAPAATSCPSLRNSLNGCQGHPPLCLSPPDRPKVSRPDSIDVRTRSIYSTISIDDINAKAVEA